MLGRRLFVLQIPLEFVDGDVVREIVESEHIQREGKTEKATKKTACRAPLALRTL